MQAQEQLTIQLLGPVSVRAADGRDLTPPGKKLRALLACLVLSGQRGWPRERLCTLLWGDRSEEQARASLRQALAELRRLLGEPGPLKTDRDIVAFDTSSASVDAVEFVQLASNGKLLEAAALYRGELLEDLSPSDTGISDWLMVERTRLREVAIDVLARLIGSQSHDAAIQTAQQLLRLDPLREDTYRTLMRLYLRGGQRAQALRQYQICGDTLQRQLGVKPEIETERLYQQIKSSNGGATPSYRAHRPTTALTVVENQNEVVPTSGDRANKPVKTRRWIAALIAGVIVALVAAGGALWLVDGLQRNRPPVFDKPSVAVLPFDNLGDDARWDRFADGLTEDIITDLAHARTLYVIARSSTGVYKGKAVDIRQVGRDLGVEYVLEGSIQTTGNQMRVTAQLIDAKSGSQVWSDRYDRPTEHIFAVQSELTQKIAATITGYQGAIAEAERAIAHRKAPQNLTAFDYYLLGLEAKHSLTKEGFLKADELFHKALELDPQLARAHVGLVQTYALMIDAGFTASVADTLDKQMVSAQKAVALDPKDGETHLALAIAYSYRGEMEKAASEFGQAEELSPNNADLLFIYAWISPALGYPERGVELAERALQLNPHYPDWYVLALRLVYFFAGNFDKSVEYAKQVKSPFALDYAFIAIAEAYLGDTAAAKSASSNVLRLDPGWSAEGWISAQGGFVREKESDLFAKGAQMAGLPMCVSDIKLRQQPNMLRLKICDEQRTSNTTK